MDTPGGWGLFAGWLLKSSAQAALLVVLVLAVQWLLRRWLTPRWRYFLWWLVVARLLMPVSLPGPVSIFNWVKWNSPPAPTMAVTPITPEIVLPASPPETDATAFEETTPELPPQAPMTITAPAMAAPARPPFDWRLGVMWLWLAGGALLGARLVWSVLRLRRELRTATPVSDPAVLALLEECRAQMQVRDRLTLLETPLVNSPALCGFWRPRLLLPPGLCGGFSASQLRFIFLHELAHVRRHDIVVNWLIALLQVLHWFNPLVWLAFARLRADRELACDALALSVAAPGEQHAYGQTIIRLLEGFARPSAMPGLVGILEDKNQMKRRIRMIAQFRRPGRWAWLSGITAAILGIACLTDAQTPKAKEAKPLVIRIESKQPQLYLDDSPVTVENLQKKLTARAASNPNLEVELRIEKLAPFGVIAEVVDATKAAKVKAVGARIQEADSAKPSGADTTSATVGSAQTEVQPSPEHRVCTVVGPDGKPVNHAAVGFCTDREGVVLGRAEILHRLTSGTSANSDANGKVQIPLDIGAHRVVAVHGVGFADVRVADLWDTHEIRLQPWGRIEGVLRIGDKVGANQSVGLTALRQNGYRRYWSLGQEAFVTRTDNQGRFAFDHVPPADVKVCRMVKGIGGTESFIHGLPVEVLPGKTTKINLGGSGMPIKGQFVRYDPKLSVLRPDQPLNWAGLHGIAWIESTSPPLPSPPSVLDSAALIPWLFSFWDSEAGLKWMRQRRSYELQGGPNNSFIAEDIPPGDYELQVLIHEKLDASKPLCSFRTNIVVPARTDGVGSTPIDIGVFPLQFVSHARELNATGGSGSGQNIAGRQIQADPDAASETMIPILNQKPTQLMIEVKLCEVAFQTDDLPELGRILGGSLERFSSAKSESRLTNAVEAAPPQVMTEARHNEVMRLLKQRSDVDFITALRVVTLSGRQTRINIGTNTDAITGQTNLTTGVSVEATVLPDGTTIEVQAAAMMKTFIGYSLDAPRNQYYDYVTPPNVDPAKVHETLPPATPERPTGSNVPQAPIRNRESMPLFRLRQTVANATVWDGQTMVLSRMTTGSPMGSRTGAPGTNNLPLVGRLFSSESFGPRNSLVLIFITPTIIDPVGNRVHSEKDLPFARENVPPQRGIK